MDIFIRFGNLSMIALIAVLVSVSCGDRIMDIFICLGNLSMIGLPAVLGGGRVGRHRRLGWLTPAIIYVAETLTSGPRPGSVLVNMDCAVWTPNMDPEYEPRI